MEKVILQIDEILCMFQLEIGKSIDRKVKYPVYGRNGNV